MRAALSFKFLKYFMLTILRVTPFLLINARRDRVTMR